MVRRMAPGAWLCATPRLPDGSTQRPGSLAQSRTSGRRRNPRSFERVAGASDQRPVRLIRTDQPGGRVGDIQAEKGLLVSLPGSLLRHQWPKSLRRFRRIIDQIHDFRETGVIEREERLVEQNIDSFPVQRIEHELGPASFQNGCSTVDHVAFVAGGSQVDRHISTLRGMRLRSHVGCLSMVGCPHQAMCDATSFMLVEQRRGAPLPHPPNTDRCLSSSAVHRALSS